jgi:hypothetical protein
VTVALTVEGRALVRKAPEVAQGLLVTGLEELPSKELQNLAAGLDRLVEILGAQGIPPKLMISQEVNRPSAADRQRPGPAARKKRV